SLDDYRWAMDAAAHNHAVDGLPGKQARDPLFEKPMAHAAALFVDLSRTAVRHTASRLLLNALPEGLIVAGTHHVVAVHHMNPAAGRIFDARIPRIANRYVFFGSK